MKFVISPAFKGLSMPRLFQVTMDEFDVERLLPTLFFLVMSGGRLRGPLQNDPKCLDDFVDRLQTHPSLRGFDGESGRRILERWVRSSIVSMSAAGRSRTGPGKIEYLHPLTLLTYKAGWPDETARQRNVDRFLYLQMVRLLDEASVASNGTSRNQPANQKLKRIFVETFGRGLDIDPAPPYDGRYDGITPLDADTLLCLRFLDGLAPTHPSGQAPLREEDFPAALPGIASDMAHDILQYLIEYREDLPTIALTRGLLALINFELFIYTVKLYYAINYLVRHEEVPLVMQRGGVREASPPGIYVDFTRERDSASDDLARECVQRDLLATRTFLDSLIRLRTLDVFSKETPVLAEATQGLVGGDYFRGLLVASRSPEAEARAQAEIGMVRAQTETAAAASPADLEAAAAYFEDLLRAPGLSSVDQFVSLLSDAQARLRVESLIKWLHSAGGLNRSLGLLRGTSIRRSSWRYQMGDDLLAALVQLAIVRQNGDGDRRVSLGGFLHFLETRFGVLVARPPDEFASSSTRLAAAENLEALKRRLRQMGFFADLSDDFTAQYLEFTAHEVSP